MRVLGIETSSRRGSVALVDGGRLVAARTHERPHGHAEELLPMLDAALAEAGWSRTSLDRIGVGVGPGSFTGLRVGIALGHGIGLGLGIPVLGVCSLRAMARAVPATVSGLRCPLLDARRGEVFCAVYAPDGSEVCAPRAVGRERALDELEGPEARVLVGEATEQLAHGGAYRTVETDLPHARWTALLAAEGPADGPPAAPLYVREPDAVRPDLPPHPLANEEES